MNRSPREPSNQANEFAGNTTRCWSDKGDHPTTAISLLSLGGMVHLTEPSARAQLSTDAWEGFLP